MTRIKIKDLPKDKKVSREELKRVLGGVTRSYSSIAAKITIGGADPALANITIGGADPALAN